MFKGYEYLNITIQIQQTITPLLINFQWNFHVTKWEVIPEYWD